MWKVNLKRTRVKIWRPVRMQEPWLPGCGERASAHWPRLGRGPQRREWPGYSLFVGRIIIEFS